jgi:hypothetical protein
VLLGVETNYIRGHIDDLFTDTVSTISAGLLLSNKILGDFIPDVALLDQNTSVVDGLGKAKFQDHRLEAAL